MTAACQWVCAGALSARNGPPSLPCEVGEMELAGEVAVVTGCGHGIGEAIAKRFAAEGAKVLVTDIDEEAVQRVAAEIGTVGLAADVTIESNVQRIAALAEDRLGPVDVWHSNAGIA